jgi:predicted nucleic acid-binding protein
MENWLHDFTATETIGIDANIFNYYFDQNPQFGLACRDFLLRVERAEVVAVTFSSVVGEVVQFIQMHTALALLGSNNWQRAQRELKTNSTLAADCGQAVLQGLAFLEQLKTGGLTIIDVSASVYPAAAQLAQSALLLISDALHAQACRLHGIKHWASNDADFDRVTFLTRWQPKP